MQNFKNAKQRAINYFTVWEVVQRKQAHTRTAWEKLKVLGVTDEPLTLDVLRFAASAEVQPSDLKKVYSAVSSSFDLLTPGDQILERGTPEYPALLAETEGAPEFLFVRGHVELLHRPALAVVGTRKPTEEGQLRARKLGYLLAKRNLVVISGLAMGIDEAAHLGALKVCGDTVAVIGSPLHMYYPKEHRGLQDHIAQVGAVATQFYPGAGIRQYHFPMRNAVMSGLCRGTVVVEAGETSGALIQARYCLNQGRKLFIPQSAIDNDRITWPKRFQAQGGVVFCTIEQVLAEIDEFLPQQESEAVTPGDAAACLPKLTVSRR